MSLADRIRAVLAAAFFDPFTLLRPSSTTGMFTGSAALPTNGDWVELKRWAPGADKSGSMFLSMRGGTDYPSNINVWDSLGYGTDETGKVYLQSPTGEIPLAAEPKRLAAPANFAAVVNGGGYAIDLSWDAYAGGTHVDAFEAQFSRDDGATWESLNGTSVGAPTFVPATQTSTEFYGQVGPAAEVKLRVRGFNEFGGGTWSTVVTVTTGEYHQYGGGGGGGSVNHPVEKIEYDDGMPYSVGGSSSGPAGGLGAEIEMIADDDEIVLRVRTLGGKEGGIGWKLDILDGAWGP